jgi:hypothetical protein
MKLELIKVEYIPCKFSRHCIKKSYYTDDRGADHIKTEYCCWCHFIPQHSKKIEK